MRRIPGRSRTRRREAGPPGVIVGRANGLPRPGLMRGRAENSRGSFSAHVTPCRCPRRPAATGLTFGATKGSVHPQRAVALAVDEAGFDNEGGVTGRSFLVKSLNGLHLIHKLRGAWERRTAQAVEFAGSPHESQWFLPP